MLGGIVAFIAPSATFTNSAMWRRSRRRRPLSSAGGARRLQTWIGTCSGPSSTSFVIVWWRRGADGRPGYRRLLGAHRALRKLAGDLAVMFLVGASSFAALGLAVAGVCKILAQSVAAVATLLFADWAFILGRHASSRAVLQVTGPWFLEVLGAVRLLKLFAAATSRQMSTCRRPAGVSILLLWLCCSAGGVGLLPGPRW